MNIKTSRLQANYGKLNNDERLKLILSAIERDDSEELKALISTTPRLTYRMPDAWLIDRCEAFSKISVAFQLITETLQRERDKYVFLIMLRKLSIALETAKSSKSEPEIKNGLCDVEYLTEHLTARNCMLWAVAEGVRKLANIVKLTPEELLVYTTQDIKERLSHEQPQLSDLSIEVNLESIAESYFNLFALFWPDLDTINRKP